MPRNSKVCPRCGTHTPAGVFTCSQCGSALGDSDTETAISSKGSEAAEVPTQIQIPGSSPSSAATLESTLIDSPQPVPSTPSSRLPDLGPRYRVECVLG